MFCLQSSYMFKIVDFIYSWWILIAWLNIKFLHSFPLIYFRYYLWSLRFNKNIKIEVWLLYTAVSGSVVQQSESAVYAWLVAHSCPTLCDPMDCSPPDSSVHGDSPGKNTRVSCHALLQGIFPTQRLNPGLLHCRWILYHLSQQGSPNQP